MATERLSETVWAATTDPRVLLEYAASRICHRHLCLVQCELAERALAASRQGAPLPPTLLERTEQLAEALRRWCFFHLGDGALREATLALEARRPLALEALPRPETPNVFGVLAVVRAAAFACRLDLPERPEQPPRGVPLFAPVLAALRAMHAAEASGQAAASLAALIRQRVPFPETENREWVAFPGIVFSGEFVLRIDGLRIGDVVRRSAFSRLAGARAVAFDEAQQNAEAESEAQARDRVSASVRLAERLRQLDVEAERAARAAAEEAAARQRERELEAEAAARQAALLELHRQAAAREAARLEAALAKQRASQPSRLVSWIQSLDFGSALYLGVFLLVAWAETLPSGESSDEEDRRDWRDVEVELAVEREDAEDEADEWDRTHEEDLWDREDDDAEREDDDPELEADVDREEEDPERWSQPLDRFRDDADLEQPPEP